MKFALTLAIASLLAATATPLAHAQDYHAHHAPPTTAAHAHSDQLWVTDVALRTGMRGIRDAVAALQHYQHEHMAAEQAVATAQLVEQHVAYLVTHCKLTPEADAALHTIISPLLRSAAAIKADPANLAPVADMRDALQAYPRQFDDPHWEPVVAGH